MHTIQNTIVTDGGPLELAAAILALAYNVPHGHGAADALKDALGLGDPAATQIETAFSYPNAAAIIHDEHGRISLYLYDSTQEKLTAGDMLEPLPAETPVGEAKPGQSVVDAADGPGALKLPETPTAGTAPGFVPDTPTQVLPAGVDPYPADPAPPQFAGIAPGDTPPLVSGEPMVLDDETRQRLAGLPIGAPEGANVTGQGQPDAPLVAGAAPVIPAPGANDLPAEAQQSPGEPSATQVAAGAADLPVPEAEAPPVQAALSAGGTVTAPQDEPGQLSAEAKGEADRSQVHEDEPTADVDTPERTQAAYNEGYAMFKSNPDSFGANPYLREPGDRFLAWNAGWDQAVKDGKLGDDYPKPVDQAGFTSAEG